MGSEDRKLHCLPLALAVFRAVNAFRNRQRKLHLVPRTGDRIDEKTETKAYPEIRRLSS